MFSLFRIQISVLLYLLTFVGCSSGLLREEAVEGFNEKLAKKQYVARKNIYVTFADKTRHKEIIFSKGTKLRIVVEQSEDWLKVRAFSTHENEEQTRGKVIFFTTRDFLNPKEQKNYSLANLQQSLNDLLKEFSP